VASILLNDTELQFPNFTIVSASAGSGKTHTLTLKLLQLLLSLRVPNNRLNNVLAMTFTKNAAAEMRQRVLEYLKKAYHGNKNILDQLCPLVSMDEANLRARCGELIDTILQDYSAFQVQTIDSFMARVFRASALEFGFSPTLEIVLNNRIILDAAFEQFTRELATDPSKLQLLEELTDILVESQNTSSRYIWNPFQKLSDEVRNLYNTLSAQSKDVLLASENGRQVNTLRREILDTFHQLYTLVRDSGLEVTKNFENVAAVAHAGDVDKLIELKSIHKPVKAGKSKTEKEKTEEWNTRFAPLQEKFNSLAVEYVVHQAYHYYLPYVEAHKLFRDTIEQIMRRNGQVILSDVNRTLLHYISEEIVPQVYFYLGDAIFHYLIDEFQDTAPVQWETLMPLFAEALSKQGSLFVVGDTKQSIYAFRYADWRIMKSVMDSNIFPSAPSIVKELETNYRSFERILDFSKTIFKEIVPKKVEGEAHRASGLSTFKQEVEEKNKKKGYVEIVSFEKDEDQAQERAKILEIVNDCHMRGYQYGDITILTPKNDLVVAISGWLNKEHIPFISHSSLDIRGRAITGDIIALLHFLDSPIDDLAFATVVLSGTFYRTLAADNVKLTQEELHSFLHQARRAEHPSPLYASFRLRYADIWQKYFDELFTVVGYLPMYDLLSEIYKQFRLFEIAPEEEGALAKLLDVMKNFEETGQNNLKDFLAFADDEADDTDWNIAVPRGEDAVSVMTIHKAKGLDNRVVIVLLVDSKLRSDNLFVEENADGVRLVHITQKNAAFDDALQELYNQYRFERAVDDLNKLYVAFTRAKEEMYVISVKTEYADEPSKFLPSSGYEPSVKPEVEKQEQSIELVVPLYHSSVRIPVSNVSSEKLALYERRRGDIIHEVLSHVEFAGADVEMLISSSIKNTAGSWMQPADEAHIKSSILEFLRLPEIAPFFAHREGRKILNEQEFVHPDGRLFRMDRIIVDADAVMVLDFKTGDDKEAYTDQLQGYVDILDNYFNGVTSENSNSSTEPHSNLPLKEEGIISLPLLGGDERGGLKHTRLFPGTRYTIRGALAFVDRKKLRLIA
jgi:ATP-dependent exoDNAse (exonuclease V) beta subunit